MKQIKIFPVSKPMDADVEIPGCLSYTIRAMNLAAMTVGEVRIKNVTKSDDSYAMLKILQTLGIESREDGDDFVVSGHIRDVKEGEYECYVGISGRTARTILSTLCIIPGTKTVNCGESFKERPVDELVDGLRQMGAEIEYLEKDGYLPLRIKSSKLNAGKVSMKGDMSSQYFSSIMMVAPMLGGETEIDVIGEQASKPFIDVTIDAMKDFGVEVENQNYKKYIIKNGKSYKCTEYLVEADAIAASYFWGMAALTSGRIRVLNLSPNSAQGDIKFADHMASMGCSVNKNVEEKWIEVVGSTNLKGLKGIEVDMNATPDSAQTLAVVAAFAKGETKMTGLHHLKIKETDRIAAPTAELKKMGVEVSSDDDSMTIVGYSSFPHDKACGELVESGGQGVSAAKDSTFEIDTYGDHRMAMAFSLAGLVLKNGIVINNPDVVSKSFPGYWEKLKDIGVRVEVV